MSLDRFKRHVAVAEIDATSASVAQTMRDRGVGCVVITREGKPIGVVTDRDLALRLVADGRNPATTAVGEITTFDPFVAREDESIETVVARMREHGIRRLPIVTASGAICGIVTGDDLFMLLGRELGGLCRMLEETADASDSR